MQAALDALPGHIAILDSHGIITGVNAQWIEYAKENGLESSTFGVGDNYLDICKPASFQNEPDAIKVCNGIKALLSGSVSAPFYYKYLCPHSGDRSRDRWFQLTVTPFRLSNKLYLLASHEDITGRHISERSQKLIETAIAQTRSGIMITNSKGVIEYVNSGFTEITGYSADEAIGKNPRILKSGRISKGTYENIWESISSGCSWKGQVCNQRKDGTQYWEEMKINPVKDPDGVITHFVSVKEDITESREQLLIYEGVIGASADGFITLDEHLRISHLSPQAETIIGLSAKEALGKDFIKTVLAVDLIHDAEDQFRLFQLGKPSRFIGRPHRTQIRQTDGHILQVELWLTALDLHGDLRFSGFIRDLSDAIRSEQALLEAKKMEGIGQMAGGLAHDFNNLLQIIGGSLQIALMHASPEAKRYIDNAISATKQGADIMKSLTTFVRRGSMMPVEANVNELLNNLVPLVQQTVGKKIDVSVSVAALNSKSMIDISGFNNAIINLAANARDAMPKGGRLILYSYSQHVAHKVEGAPIDLPEGDYIVVGVDDTGSGMPPEVQKQAFEPFFTTKEAGKGTGLGLAMVYGFCRQSDGSARISSTPALGTSVQLILPVVHTKFEGFIHERST